MNDFWTACLERLKEIVAATPSIYRLWISTLTVVDWNPKTGRLKLAAPQQKVQLIRQAYTKIIQQAAGTVAGRTVTVTFVSEEDAEKQEAPAAPAPAPARAKGKAATDRESMGLIERFTFDTYVSGSANQLAVAAAQHVASTPGHSYNPLYIYGGEDSYSIDIPIGNYFNYSVYPTCGLSTTDNLIGEVDDPRYFAHPSHVDAKILWFGRGFIDYRIPNMLPPGQKIDRLTLSFEISSEAPGVNNDWPSDISFFLNNTKVGSWTSPGDFGDVHGMFTPDWWFPNWNQYGLLKMLVIDRHGTFIDGLKISDVNTQQLTFTSQDDMVFRFQVDEPSQNIGGLTLFGKDFGNYNQDINVKVHYTPNV